MKKNAEEIAQELWIAREKLKAQGRRTDLETKISKLPTWTQYCQDIGGSKEVVNRWLNRFFPPLKKAVLFLLQDLAVNLSPERNIQKMK